MESAEQHLDNANCSSFVGTYMEREGEALMIENLSKK